MLFLSASLPVRLPRAPNAVRDVMPGLCADFLGMKLSMCLTGQGYKVLWPVVILNAIDVMDVLKRCRRPAICSLPVKAVLKNVSVAVGLWVRRHPNQDVASTIDNASALPIPMIRATFWDWFCRVVTTEVAEMIALEYTDLCARVVGYWRGLSATALAQPIRFDPIGWWLRFTRSLSTINSLTMRWQSYLMSSNEAVPFQDILAAAAFTFHSFSLAQLKAEGGYHG